MAGGGGDRRWPWLLGWAGSSVSGPTLRPQGAAVTREGETVSEGGRCGWRGGEGGRESEVGRREGRSGQGRVGAQGPEYWPCLGRSNASPPPPPLSLGRSNGASPGECRDGSGHRLGYLLAMCYRPWHGLLVTRGGGDAMRRTRARREPWLLPCARVWCACVRACVRVCVCECMCVCVRG